jgi:hypothetical protein
VGGVVGHGEKQPLTPTAHPGGIGGHDRDL